LIFPFLKKQTRITKTIFLISLDIFLFCFAINLVSESRIKNNKAYFGNLISTDTINKMLVVVNDIPVETEKFLKCRLSVLEVKKDTAYVQTKGNLIAYFKKQKTNVPVNYGQTLLINARLLEVEPPKNPLEFDYKTYLENKQVLNICFIDSFAYETIDEPGRLSVIWETGLRAKEFILGRLKSSELTQNAYAICAALLTGYDNDIDSSVMEAFSHTGTLHVLSVSGLHTGLIYLALAFLFDLFDRRKKYRVAKFTFITVCLWCFALITGFSAPVLRAVIMFNLLGLGKIFFRNNYRNQVNILLVSAFMLLCYDPFLIMDIGFQLSYFALFGILFFQPIFHNLWQPENRFVNYTWKSITASFAATLTTLPFTLFYFKQFPIWFFICNLLVVPMTFVILLLGILVVLKVSKIAVVINYIIKFLTWFIALFNSPGIGYIDNVHFTWIDAAVLSMLIILFSITFRYRTYKHAVYTLLFIIAWQINGIVSSYLGKTQNMFVVYHVKREAAYCVKNNKNVLLDSVGRSNYNYHVKPHLISFNYPAVSPQDFNRVKSGDKNILVLTRKNFWPVTDYNNISVLVIANNFKLRAEDLEAFSNLKILVADGSNNNFSLKQLAKLCSKFGFEFYSTREKGAYILNL